MHRRMYKVQAFVDTSIQTFIIIAPRAFAIMIFQLQSFELDEKKKSKEIDITNEVRVDLFLFDLISQLKLM